MSELAKEDGLEKNEIRRLRIELVDENRNDESESFYHDHSDRFRYFPKLDGVDVLVPDSLFYWGRIFEETYWGACPESNIRIINTKTGEWINEQTAGPYLDWIDTGHGKTRDYKRIDDNWDEEDEEDVAERYKSMMKMQEPLPQIDLNY